MTITRGAYLRDGRPAYQVVTRKGAPAGQARPTFAALATFAGTLAPGESVTIRRPGIR